MQNAYFTSHKNKIRITGAVRAITAATGAYALPTGRMNFRFIACYLSN